MAKPNKGAFASEVRLWLFPKGGRDREGTGLTFTDLLYGFVARELLIRLTNWSTLPGEVRGQLIVGAVLLLGSWIGYRRTRYISRFAIRFFNLPLLRFLLEQAAIFFYFRVATETRNVAHPHFDANTLGQATLRWLFWIFVIYVAWDACGLAMRHVSHYELEFSGWEIVITAGVTGGIAVLYWWQTAGRPLSASAATHRFWFAVGLMLLYRWLKEILASYGLRRDSRRREMRCCNP